MHVLLYKTNDDALILNKTDYRLSPM